MTERTTFALDKATVKRLRFLAARWKVSQAEVVRRAIAEAETHSSPTEGNPVTYLQTLHKAGHGLVKEEADGYMAEVRKDRKAWRGE